MVGRIARYERKFHCPTGIDGQQVSLTIELTKTDGSQPSLTLNGNPLSLTAESECVLAASITNALAPFNVLTLSMVDQSCSDPSPPPLDSFAQVSLRIATS